MSFGLAKMAKVSPSNATVYPVYRMSTDAKKSGPISRTLGAYIQNVIGSGLDKGTRGDVEVEALSHEMDPSGPEGTGVNKLN